MNKDKIIKASSEFSEIIQEKQFYKNFYFSLYYKERENPQSKYGITVPKKVGHAVIRNKLKRQLKNIIMANEKNIQKGYNYVIIIKEEARNLNYQELETKLMELLQKVRNK